MSIPPQAPLCDSVPDSQYGAVMRCLPRRMRGLALLARFDRPIGWWLLFWPCGWGIALAGGLAQAWPLVFWMLLGAIAMRSAGCVYNDIIDRDLDRMVARTQSRPLASGAISLTLAWVWLVCLCLIGLVVLLGLNRLAQITALASLALVAAYPFMKRISWWPQAWLGLVFSWGALVGWIAVTGRFALPMALLYAGSIAWVIGYDTLYALQDHADDALVGIRSSARRLGSYVRAGVAGFYAVALIFWALSFWQVRPDPLALAALGPIALHLMWQVVTLSPKNGLDGLAKFRANRFAGLLMFLGCAAVGSA